MKIYTKTGDNGTTGRFGGCRVNKNHPVVETYGTVDELNSILGLAISFKPSSMMHKKLERIQHELFEVGADLSAPFDTDAKVRRIDTTYTHALENEIDEMVALLPPLTQFILPGGTNVASTLHHARTVCRRAERCFLAAQEIEKLNQEIIRYLNRLSDWLFCLARFANHESNCKDIVWNKK